MKRQGISDGKESTHLVSCVLSPNGQPQRMTTTAVGTGFLQSFDIVDDLSAEVVLDLHVGQGGRDIKDLLVAQFADLACWMDVEAGEEARGGVVTDAEE